MEGKQDGICMRAASALVDGGANRKKGRGNKGLVLTMVLDHNTVALPMRAVGALFASSTSVAK
jgi:hypothetical protein